MNWAARSQPIKVGDQVVYSRRFLQSISCFTGEMPQARGVVMALETIGKDTVLAVIDWQGADMPERVNVKNLSRVSALGVLDLD